MFPYLRIPSRPIRYAVIATHAFREALDDVEVDLSKVEQGIADKLEALSAKVDELQAKLEALDETSTDAPAPEPKAKTKRRTATNKSGAKKR